MPTACRHQGTDGCPLPLTGTEVPAYFREPLRGRKCSGAPGSPATDAQPRAHPASIPGVASSAPFPFSEPATLDSLAPQSEMAQIVQQHGLN